MRRFTVVILSLVALLFLAACSEEGAIDFYNSTDENVIIRVDYSNYTIPPDHTLSRKWSLNKTLFETETKDINVKINEKLFLFPQEYSLKISPGSHISENIEYTAGGLKISNNSSWFVITAVYISPSNSAFWGSNTLPSDLNSQEYCLWNLTPGYWDILVRDNWGDEFVIYEENFRAGVLNTYNYTGFRDSKHKNTKLKAEQDLNLNQNTRVEIIEKSSEKEFSGH
jgi:hypothetical protein